MATTTFIIGDSSNEYISSTSTPLQVQVTLTEVTIDGHTSLQITLDTSINPFGPADLRGFFFNILTDSALGTLSVSGTDVTAHDFVPPADLPQNDADLNGGGVAIDFEGGIQIGTTGAGTDFITSTTFTLSRTGADFSLSELIGQQLGIRATSVPDGSGGTGSTKLGGYVPSTFDISGTKVIDVDGDGTLDAGDTTPHAGVTIFMDSNGNGSLDGDEKSTITDASGNWSITGLTAGDVDGDARVRELVSGDYVTTIGSDGIVVTGEQSGIVFANFETFDLSGHKYTDVNGNGVIDGDDATLGIGGVTIFIDANNNGENDDGAAYTTTTAADGSWSFSGLGTGLVGKKVYEVVDGDYVQTVGIGGLDVTGTSGADQADLDFANFETFDLSGHKYTDVNGNGVIDGDDATLGIGGVTIFIDANGNEQNDDGYSTTTAADGSWSFSGLGTGLVGAKVYEVVDGDYVQTVGIGGLDITGTSGADQTDLDFANFEKFDISGTKYFDANGDGLISGDSGLDDITVFIDVNKDGDYDVGVDVATTTANGGTWSFNDLDFTYAGLKVYEVVPEGYVQTLGEDGHTITGTSGTDQTGLDFANAEEVCHDGFSQGYWATHIGGRGRPANAWDDGYAQGDKYDTVFGVNAFGAVVGDKTLLQAITTDGGGEAALARQAVAALLNSVSQNDGLTSDYRFDSAEIIDAVQEVYGINDGIDGNDGVFNQTKATDLQNLLEFWNIVPEKHADGELCGAGSIGLLYDKDGNPATTSDLLNGGSYTGGLSQVLANLNPTHGWAA